MQIIPGQNVDLISPFPPKEIHRMYGWIHCYRSIVETDESPKTQEDFIAHTQGYLPLCGSWGIIDKNQITNTKHEAPLVGVLIYEPASARTGYMHVATARKAWRTGLVDEAAELVLEEIFNGIPTLTRLGAYMLEKNFPARSLAKRHGFEFEGLFRDVVVQNGEPANLIYFGLTRKNWETCHKHLSDPQLDSQEVSLEDLEGESKKPTPPGPVLAI